MSVNAFRAALVVEGEYMAAWQYQMLERLLALGGVRLVMVVFRQPVAPTLLQRVNAILLNTLHYVDAKLFNCPVAAQHPMSFLNLLGDVNLCDAGGKRYHLLLEQQSLDVVIDLSAQAPLPELVGAAKYGVWRHFFGEAFACSDRYTGIREYAHQQAEILSGIERWTRGNTAPEYIFAATTSTDGASINRGVERTLWKMADFLPQRLQELLNLGEKTFLQNVTARMQPLALAPPIQSVSLGAVTILKVLWRYLCNFINKLFISLFRAEQWILLSKATGQVTEAGVLEQFRKWLPPRDRFWADPFVVEYAGEQYVFFEELLYARGIGHLACVRLNADGSHSEPVTILEKPYHLSYPFVFQHQGNYYMIPETAGNQSVEVYRCEDFPHRWVFEKNLMTGVEAYDATLMEYEGRWWLFASMRHDKRCSPSEALYLFHADDPLSTQWQAHPQNPVVASAARARPAGRIFNAAGQWYRPSQNCAGTYGRGLNINRIQQLDVNTYREQLISTYLPDGQHDMNGMHTLGVSSPVSVMDAVHVHRRLGIVDRWVVKLNRFFSQPLVISS
ncbi:MAG: hypothetical protein BWK73_13330 [Thiothrix lacustris]|uniref:Glucosamine inositolphosphorylceramide transferase 1 N-terminal domain-containing protein n=1 Tax=Thiothrix lacustris TaxID=525917 RepID=A0A1Y1QSZ2_9GAMM|nr:MAG: hypothetical protein BWK73_13330 [Thiothrix lacustris]